MPDQDDGAAPGTSTAGSAAAPQPGGQVYDKTLSSFSPVNSRSPAECERHYRDVHTRWARHLLRDRAHVVSYHTNRADAQYDVRGGFGQQPDAWRFVILRLQRGTRLGLSRHEQEQVAQDHRNFLRDLRSFRLRERAVFDGLCGQTVLVKYLFDYERGLDDDAAELAARLGWIADQLAERAAEGDFGLRLLLHNTVTAEQATEAVDEPGQRSVGRLVEPTAKVGFLECYFDQQEWAEELFLLPQVCSLLRDSRFAAVRGYRIEESCGFDHRGRSGSHQTEASA